MLIIMLTLWSVTIKIVHAENLAEGLACSKQLPLAGSTVLILWIDYGQSIFYFLPGSLGK